MKEIDVFKLAEKLGFDVRGAELNNNLNSLVIINENCDTIPGFNSNKVIAYNCKKNISIKRNCVALHLKEYIISKLQNEKVYLANINKDLIENIDINLLTVECLKNGLINKKKEIKKLYKTMY